MHYVHKKATWGSEIATFRKKTLHLFRVIRLNWLAKIELKGLRGPWSSILVLVLVTDASKKMLKRNWNWRNSRLFRHIFIIGEISIGGMGSLVPPSPPLATPMLQLRKTKKVFANFPRGFWRFPTVQKIVLSSSRGQGNFRGLEASRSRPRTSNCVLEDVLEAKDVFEDSTSDVGWRWFLLHIFLTLAYVLLFAKVLMLIFIFTHITLKSSSL